MSKCKICGENMSLLESIQYDICETCGKEKKKIDQKNRDKRRAKYFKELEE